MTPLSLSPAKRRHHPGRDADRRRIRQCGDGGSPSDSLALGLPARVVRSLAWTAAPGPTLGGDPFPDQDDCWDFGRGRLPLGTRSRPVPRPASGHARGEQARPTRNGDGRQPPTIPRPHAAPSLRKTSARRDKTSVPGAHRAAQGPKALLRAGRKRKEGYLNRSAWMSSGRAVRLAVRGQGRRLDGPTRVDVRTAAGVTARPLIVPVLQARDLGIVGLWPLGLARGAT